MGDSPGETVVVCFVIPAQAGSSDVAAQSHRVPEEPAMRLL